MLSRSEQPGAGAIDEPARRNAVTHNERGRRTIARVPPGNRPPSTLAAPSPNSGPVAPHNRRPGLVPGRPGSTDGDHATGGVATGTVVPGLLRRAHQQLRPCSSVYQRAGFARLASTANVGDPPGPWQHHDPGTSLAILRILATLRESSFEPL